jgi:pimeloyl-ACP methyl ester carboxylesterase
MAEVSSERVELRLVAGLHAERGHLCLGYDLGDRDVEGHLRRAALVGERDVVGAANRGCQLFALRPGAGIVGEPLVVVDAGERAASPLPERLLTADPEPVVDNALGEWGSAADSFPSEVRDAYVNALRDPAVVHTICEEYRAATTIDRAGRRIEIPTLVLWSEGSGIDTWYADEGGPLAHWRAWSRLITARAVPGGHFFPESNPTTTVAELLAFFAPV